MKLIRPDSNLPARVQAFMTTRDGGVSQGPYHALNLGMHVGDDPDSVVENRRRLKDELTLPSEPCWLNQVHGTTVALSGDADASYTREPCQVLCIQTADCLPVLLWSDDGQEIAAVHAGWRGLAGGVIARAVTRFRSRNVSAWIGPHIRACHYEVDRPLYETFAGTDSAAFQSAPMPDRWQLSLVQIAVRQLEVLGVSQVEDNGECTCCEEDRYFSYRRDGECGRMAALIWISDSGT